MEADTTHGPETRSGGTQGARRILRRVFQDWPGRMAVRLWDGETLRFGEPPPACTLVFRQPRTFRDLVLFRDPLRLAEDYFRGRVDVEGDLYAALELQDYLPSLRFSFADRVGLLVAALLLRGDAGGVESGTPARHQGPWRCLLGRHGKAANRAAIAFHYDVSDDFYRLWLDEQMVYSCAYFEEAGESIDQAQENKLDYICRKLRLQPGERLLDIGCGWGALIRWAAEHHGVLAQGVTLSRNQYEHCRRQIAERGLAGGVSVELRNYRDLAGEGVFDKIASVGMFEHVGLKNLPRYFGLVRRLLKPDGLFLNHGITHDQEGWRRTPGTQFINRCVFPDGELDTVGNVQRALERPGFEILDVESLRPHYALTLRHWVRRLEANREAALRLVPEPTYRVWRLYMAACALQFEAGGMGVYQILAARRGRAAAAVPLTRRDLYR